jgi:uncharacterized protein (DUF1697 family)
MTTCVALLRAVNVGTANRIRMLDLKAAFVTAGYNDAVTHIQTGNVIFTTGESEATTRRRVEQSIHDALGLTITAIIRSSPELAAVTVSNPFIAAGSDPKQLYVGFLSAAPAADAVKALGAMSFGDDTFEVVGREIFLRYANGAGTTKLTNAVIEKKLGVDSTARNWNVTTKLAELAAAARR